MDKGFIMRSFMNLSSLEDPSGEDDDRIPIERRYYNRKWLDIYHSFIEALSANDRWRARQIAQENDLEQGTVHDLLMFWYTYND